MSVAELLLDSARARSQTLAELARELAEPLSSVRAAAGRLLSNLYAVPPTMPDPALTFDQLLARHGRASAAGSLAGRSVPLRYRGAGYCGEAGALAPPPGYWRVPELKPGQHYFLKIVAGDNPSAIANRHTGEPTLGRVRELLDANPSKPKVGTPGTWTYNFASLVAGESIILPDSWQKFLGKNDAGTWGPDLYGGVYPVKPTTALDPGTGVGVGTYTASLPAGAIQATKVKLGQWNLAEKQGLAYPGPFDLNDIIDEPFRGAVRAFQLWSKARGVSLPTDGGLDPATHTAILAYGTGAVPPTPPVVPPSVLPPPVVPPPALPPLPPAVNPDLINVLGSEKSSDSSGMGALLLLALAGFFLMQKGR